jgi:hypothetical protein
LKRFKLTENLRNRIRGWFPKEPKLPKKYSENKSENKKISVLDKPINELSFDTILSILVGALLILIGAVAAFNVNGALAALQFFAILVPPLLLVGYFFGFWIGVAGIVLVIVFVATRKIGKTSVAKNLNMRRLLPYGAAAILVFATCLVSNAGIQFAFAIPITLVLSGILVLKGLKRFAVTLPAFSVLLVCVLLLGTAFAGATTVITSRENHYLAVEQAPNVAVVNISVNTLDGDIRLHFGDNDSQICQISFVKQYGDVQVGRGVEYRSQGTYGSEPANIFNYTIEGGQANITAISSMITIYITVNPNLKYNLNFYTVFGGITIDRAPNGQTIQSTNLTSKWGYVDNSNFQNELKA